MHLAVILLILGGLLSGLIGVAVVQRRGREALVVSPGIYVNGPQSGFEASRPFEHNAPTGQQTWTLMSIGRIAAGVWLGLWLFVFSAAIPAIIIIRTLEESRR